MNKLKQVYIPASVESLTFAQYVGRRIRSRRTALKMTQDEVVAACDISKTFLSELENGKRSISLYKLTELSSVLGRSVDWFVKGWNK